MVPRSAGAIDAETVKRHALANGPAYAHPRQVYFVDGLPLSGTNKINRSALVARGGRGRARPRNIVTAPAMAS